MLIPLFEGSLEDRGRIKDLRILGFLTIRNNNYSLKIIEGVP